MRRSKIFLKLILIAVVGVVFLYPGYRRFEQFRQRLESLKKDVSVLEEKNRELRQEIEDLKNDPFYLEKLAREMGLVKEGEVVYKVISEEEKEDEGESEKSETSQH